MEHVGERVAPLGPSYDHEVLSADGPAHGVLDALGGAVPAGAHPHEGVGGGVAVEALGGGGGDDGAPALPDAGGQGGAAGWPGEGDRGAVGDAVDLADDEGVVVEVLQAPGGARDGGDGGGVDGQDVGLLGLAVHGLGQVEAGDEDGVLHAVDGPDGGGQGGGVGLRRHPEDRDIYG